MTQTETAVRPVTVNGVTATAGMTGREIFEAHLTAAGGQANREGFGHRLAPPPNFHTESTQQRMAQGDTQSGAAAPGTVAGKAPPPSPKQLEAANKPQGAPSPARTQDFNDEMRAKGLMARTDGRIIAAGEVDQEAIELVTARYKALVSHDMPEATRLRFKAAFEKDLKDLYDGKQLTGRQIAELRKTGNIETFVPKTKEEKQLEKLADKELSTPTPNAQHRTLTADGQKLEQAVLAEFRALPESERSKPERIDEYNAGLVNIRANEHGMVHVSHFPKEALHGYTLPDFLGKEHGGQHYPPQVIFALAEARRQGVTQQQLNQGIRDEMVKDGWLHKDHDGRLP